MDILYLVIIYLHCHCEAQAFRCHKMFAMFYVHFPLTSGRSLLPAKKLHVLATTCETREYTCFLPPKYVPSLGGDCQIVAVVVEVIEAAVLFFV